MKINNYQMFKIIFIILLLLPLMKIFPQNISAGMPSIDGADAKFIDTKKVETGETRSMPPHIFYKIEGYIFEIKFNVTLINGINTLDSLYSIVCYMPDRSVQRIKINPGNLKSISNNNAVYSFELETKKIGWVKIILVSNDEIQSQPDSDFYIQKSNQQIIYLDTSL